MGQRTIKDEDVKHLSHITIEKACVGVVWTDLNWRIYRANEAAGLILGYRPEELIGTDYLNLIHPEDRKKIAGIVSERLKGKKRDGLWTLQE